MLRYDLVINAHSATSQSGSAYLNRELYEFEKIRRAKEADKPQTRHTLRHALLLAAGLGAVLGVMQITQALTTVA
ncbi:hypothetical protein L0V05_12300 [Tabrizicola sp. J26]|uniref:hypothetical protein n=1 Tax=Alitabrizicola rongguiensis TaxID=2909234 RepID=UPI001F47AF2B|nr:hypothetical protein [Tabrizicola rongguiensis]MCF1709596.1 hypothetical protein [Tabrizicola rongguiensis]